MKRISLVISDVDGTLVTTDKTLTERSRTAVARLDAHGIAFSIVSSRPSFGLRELSKRLALHHPIGAYNGGALLTPDLKVIEQKLIAPEAVRRALEVFGSFGIDVWIFTVDSWIVQNPRGAHVELEAHTIETRPTVVDSLEHFIDGVAKIVGVSTNPDRLVRCELAARQAVADTASIARSQSYYLDVTPAGVNKGTFVDDLIGRLGLSPSEVVTIGDMENDVAMFRKSGFSIAMGNAAPNVRQCADAATLTNDEDGFADAVERLILPRADGIAI
jgi:Cof subfamily protein (haloacid dehalogenase superfamily)